jgi:uncharacterized damage-inducible protein DinB
MVRRRSGFVKTVDKLPGTPSVRRTHTGSVAQETASIRRFYADWSQYRSRLVEAVRDLTDEQLALRAGPEHFPIWALAAHSAGARVYWLCGVLGEPGADMTPFRHPLDELGWEDDPDHPRTAAELVFALESSGAVIDRCLDTWTPDMLEVKVEREYRDVRSQHTRRSVVLRLLSHDAFHGGEISQLLGANGLPAIDLWARRTT